MVTRPLEDRTLEKQHAIRTLLVAEGAKPRQIILKF